MTNPLPSIDWVLEHELELSTRYRRFVSFVLIRADDDPEGLDVLLSDTIRSTDVRFKESRGISVVMAETESADAIQAIQRYRRTIDGSLKVNFAVATFPSDGRTPLELRRTAHNRMEIAMAQGRGAVVAEG